MPALNGAPRQRGKIMLRQGFARFDNGSGPAELFSIRSKLLRSCFQKMRQINDNMEDKVIIDAKVGGSPMAEDSPLSGAVQTGPCVKPPQGLNATVSVSEAKGGSLGNSGKNRRRAAGQVKKAEKHNLDPAGKDRVDKPPHKGGKGGRKQAGGRLAGQVKDAMRDAVDASTVGQEQLKKSELHILQTEVKMLEASLRRAELQEIFDDIPLQKLSFSRELQEKREAETMRHVLNKKRHEKDCGLVDGKGRIEKVQDELELIRKRIEYLKAVEELEKINNPQPKTQLELDEIAVIEHKAAEKCRLYWAEVHAPECPFEVPDSTTPFLLNLPDLLKGESRGLGWFLPASVAPLTRTYLATNLSYSYTDTILRPKADFRGWKDSVLISDFSSTHTLNNISSSLVLTSAVGGLAGAASYIPSLVPAASTLSKIKFVGTTALVATACLAALEWSRYVVKAELRAIEVDRYCQPEDSRPMGDRALSSQVADTLVSFQPFMVFTLTTGDRIFSFDPSLAGLVDWAESKHKVLGCVNHDATRRFRRILISSTLYCESVSRRTITTTVYDKARAIERVNKILENCDRVAECHDTVLSTGTFVFKDTLQFVSALLTRDPHTPPHLF